MAHVGRVRDGVSQPTKIQSVEVFYVGHGCAIRLALGFLGPYTMQQWSGRHIPCHIFSLSQIRPRRFRCLESKPRRQVAVQIFRENWQTTSTCNHAHGAQVALVAAINFISQTNHSQPSDLLKWMLPENHLRLCAHDLWPSVLARNPRPQVFSPPQDAASSRTPRSKKPVASGPSRCFGLNRFRLWATAISGHASPGNGSQANIQ
jgi:hypothetical protein